MERLRRQWWVFLTTSLLLGASILLVAPHYTGAQRSRDVATFRSAVAEDGAARAAAAGVIDIGFAGSYALLGMALTRGHIATRVGAGLIVIGAASDVVENALVLVGIDQGDELQERVIDTMRVFGAVKWAGIIGGAALICVGLALDRRADDC